VGAGEIVQLDVSARPNYGSYDLASGFTPNPARYEVIAGGQIAASSLRAAGGGPCEAENIDDHPDVRIRFDGDGARALRFTVDGDGADTTLAVHTPAGQWHCNDDGDDEDPIVELPGRPGRYNVFVGTVTQGRYPEVELLVQEMR
jgi:hypothetical protein